MLSVLRVALYLVLFFTLLSVVIAIASANTGLVEKAALIALAGVLIWLASLLRRIGAHSPSRSS